MTGDSLPVLPLSWTRRPAAAASPGWRIRALRLGRFLTQEDLASLAGLTRTTVRRLEAGCGRPRIHTVLALATALGVTPEQLVPDPAAMWGEEAHE